MSKELVKSVLMEYGSENVPVEPGLWPVVRSRAAQLDQRREQSSGKRSKAVPRVAWVTAALALALAMVVGMSLFSATEPMPASAAEILARAEDAAPLESFHGASVARFRNKANEEYSETRSEWWYLAPNNHRLESHMRSANGEDMTAIWVSNGETGWRYDSSSKSVVPLTGRQLESSFGATSVKEMLGESMTNDLYDAQVVGREQVGERVAYVVELSLKPSDEWPQGMSPAGAARTKLWVDSEVYIILHMESWDTEGAHLASEVFETFEPNGPLDPGLFNESPDDYDAK